MNTADAFHFAIIRGMSVLGEPVGDLLERHLEADCIDLNSRQPVDALELDEKLRQFFGAGSAPLMRVIHQRFLENLGYTEPALVDRALASLSYAEQIDLIMQSHEATTQFSGVPDR